MSRMLVNDKQFVFKLDQPVSIKDLTDNPVTAAILHGQQFFLEQIQLLGIFDLRFRGGSCILRRCRGLSGSSCCGHLFLYRVLPVFRRHCLHEEIIFLRYGCGADCFGNFWCITVQDGLRFSPSQFLQHPLWSSLLAPACGYWSVPRHDFLPDRFLYKFSPVPGSRFIFCCLHDTIAFFSLFSNTSGVCSFQEALLSSCSFFWIAFHPPEKHPGSSPGSAK